MRSRILVLAGLTAVSLSLAGSATAGARTETAVLAGGCSGAWRACSSM